MRTSLDVSKAIEAALAMRVAPVPTPAPKPAPTPAKEVRIPLSPPSRILEAMGDKDVPTTLSDILGENF